MKYLESWRHARKKKWAFTKAINLGQGEEHQGPALSITIFVCFFGWLVVIVNS